ncbi:basic salivary proline-rich protein 3-like [Epinephelus fuscoguttatus]|uniref:basic salivary proline-rich protein 3-like n=1 Tax=Epinephelus fuscoguttatus TaxID=293821 RepID=UPI0020D1788C|nr:basic salivary proline-rich protein 3-like [Epinephelus fuscoguttatus]
MATEIGKAMSAILTLSTATTVAQARIMAWQMMLQRNMWLHMSQLPAQIRGELLGGPISSDGLFRPLLQSATTHLQNASEEADRVWRHTSWSRAAPRPQRSQGSGRDRWDTRPRQRRPTASAVAASRRAHPPTTRRGPPGWEGLEGGANQTPALRGPQRPWTVGKAGPKETQWAPTQPRPTSNCSVRPPQWSRPGPHHPQQIDPQQKDEARHQGARTTGPTQPPRTPTRRSTGQPSTPPVPPQTATDPKPDPQPIRPAPHRRPHTNGQAHTAQHQNTPRGQPPAPTPGPPARGRTQARPRPSREGQGEGGGRREGEGRERSEGGNSPPGEPATPPQAQGARGDPTPPQAHRVSSPDAPALRGNRPVPRSPTEPGSRPGFKGKKVHLTHA